MENRRLEELDSLRGLAAITVVFGHYLTASLIDNKTIIEYGPLRVFFSANEAVLLFFLLSGFVLFLPFSRKESYSFYEYGNFAIKRIFRIYIPYLIAIIFAIIANFYLYSGELKNYSEWLNKRWSNEVTFQTILDHILFLGEYEKQFNVVTWSLVEEMRISLIFPLLAYVVLKSNWKKSFLIGVILFTTSFVLEITGDKFSFVAKTLLYLIIFLIGALLAKYRDEIILKLKTFTNKQQWALIICSLILYLYAKPSFILNALFGMEEYLRVRIDFIFTITGAVLIVMTVLSFDRKFKFMKSSLIKFFGNISYSLYLYHMVVLLSVAHYLGDKVSSMLVFCVSFVITIIISYLSYRFVEKPFINLAKTIVNSRNKKYKSSYQLIK